jgi:pimeloyl-ACP methyl ester carboxylesterase
MEYQRTHYAIRLVALQLAKAGFHVLRFDYHGIGDSSGDIDAGQFELWIKDIELAVRELYEMSGARDLTIVGLRMGAALAVETLTSRNIKAKSIVFWDPVLSGREYLSTLQTMHAELVSSHTLSNSPTDELIGALYPQGLRNAIQDVDLTKRLCRLESQGAALVVSEDRPDYREFFKRMQSHWPGARYQTMNEPIRWDNLKMAYEARMTGPIMRAVAEAVESLA